MNMFFIEIIGLAVLGLSLTVSSTPAQHHQSLKSEHDGVSVDNYELGELPNIKALDNLIQNVQRYAQLRQKRESGESDQMMAMMKKGLGIVEKMADQISKMTDMATKLGQQFMTQGTNAAKAAMEAGTNAMKAMGAMTAAMG